MSEHVILVENLQDWKPTFPEATLVTAKDYIGQQEYLKEKHVKIINFCRSYRYLSVGYYCSLLAEARRHHVVPPVRTLTDLSSKAIYSINAEDLDVLVQKTLRKASEGTAANTFELQIFFGAREPLLCGLQGQRLRGA